jgi:hypothetical protein
MVQIWWKNEKEECIIDDCFEISPLILIADLKRQDKLDGTTGGKYYIVRN